MQDFFQKPLAIVDVETTGLSPRWDRIIELCILKVEKGEIVDKLDTLINPQTHVSPFIESVTGIKASELEEAPIFIELQDRVHEFLEGSIFIAHNVNFDYSFLREEFKRGQVQFSAKTICTVRLSRQLFPQHRSHSLSSLIERFGFTCHRRHRAYDDAHVLYQFLNQVTQYLPATKVKKAVSLTMKNTFSSDERLAQNIEDLPETAGVYIFYDKDNMPLYVGKSTNIKERVKSHLTPSINSFREFSIMKNLSRIEYVKTAGELGALLVESEKVKELQPVFNRKLRLKKKFVAVVKDTTEDGFYTLTTSIIDNFQDIDFQELFGVFKSKRSIQETLGFLVRKYFLCPKILGIETSSSGCFEYKLGRCKGACVGKETSKKHNARFLIAFGEQKQFRPWIYDGPVEIVEKNEDEGLYESFLIDKWCLLGKRIGEYEYSFNRETPFDLDSYKIMSSYLKYKKVTIRRVDMDKLHGYSPS